MKKAKICFSEKYFETEVAETLLEKAKGLSGHDILKPDSGMTFIFYFESIYPFTMKGMKFPLDIIYISKDMRVVDIKKSCKPCSSIFCAPIIPRKKAKYVVELNAGETDKYGISIGDKFSILF